MPFPDLNPLQNMEIKGNNYLKELNRNHDFTEFDRYLFCLFQGNFTGTQYEERILSHVLDRKWALITPHSKVHEVVVSHGTESSGGTSNLFSFSSNLCPSLGEELKEARLGVNSFYVIRDDLLHPLISGNKTRKLDALLPLMEAHLVTDVVRS